MTTTHHSSRARPPQDRGDRGSVTLFLVISVVGLLGLAGLVVDGGAKIRAVQRADALAAQAARAGGQAINVPAAITGQAPTINPQAAVVAGTAYLAHAGVTGTVTVTNAGRSVHVTVTTTTPTIFLGVIGISSLTVHGQATVTLVTGAGP